MLVHLRPPASCTPVDSKGESDPTGDQLTHSCQPKLGMLSFSQDSLCQPLAKPGHTASLGGPFWEDQKVMGLLSLLWETTVSVMTCDLWRQSYNNTCPTTSGECHQHEVASRMQKSLEKSKNVGENIKRTKSIVIAMTSEHCSPGESGLSVTNHVLCRPQGLHSGF